MISHVLVGSNDLEKAKAFYDAVLAPVGGKRGTATEKFQGYTNDAGPILGVCKPYDAKPATSGNGTMVVLAASSPAMVQATYAAAMAHGATDEGPPGPRSESFYAAYFRDLDGNKIAVCFFS